MRVISGAYKGRRLLVEKGGRVRPTSERVRAAIFDILPVDLSGTAVLDLCAGSGAMGIEALSRGGRTAVFVDSANSSCRLILRNLSELGLSEPARVMNKKAGGALKLLGAENMKFDLVFLDPPYKSGEAEKIMQLLASLSLLSREAVVVAEHKSSTELADRYGSLKLRDRRTYGETAVSFYQGEEEQ